MRSAARSPRTVAASTLALLVGALITAVPASAEPAQAPAESPAATAQCTIRDGTAPLGSKVGSNPVRYEFPDSPYVGLRWNSCTNKVVIYYGGYDPQGFIEFYHLRHAETGSQVQVPEGLRRTWTVNAPNGVAMTISAQNCIRGSVLESSNCTRWSPPVTVQLR